MSQYYNFILYQWDMDKYPTTQINNAVAKVYISKDEAITILATPQVTQQKVL